MTRGGVSIESGGLYHIISRFVGKQWLMKGGAERNMYLSLLGLALMETDWQCVAYALMSSHLHLALLAGKDTLASWLRPMHTQFANWLNLREERIGAVFVRGPNVGEVQPAGAAQLINYIHHNPVRAGVVGSADESEWTSHRSYIGAASRPRWLHVDRGLELAGFADGETFGNWSQSANVNREDLDTYRVGPVKRRGRPPTIEQVPPARDVYEDGRAAISAAIAAFAAGPARSGSRASDHA